MTVDIVIKTYPGDYNWLPYCLKSIQRFATGFRKVIVITSDLPPPTGAVEKVFFIKEVDDKYMHQQVIKLHADCFTDAQLICFTDSDTIFTCPINPNDLIVESRPIWNMTPYGSIEAKDRVWQKPTERVMGEPVEYEFMRRHPFVVSRSQLSEFRAFVWQKHGQSIEAYVHGLGNRDFSEFNALGAYLFRYRHGEIEWRNTDNGIGSCFVHQSYSWGGLTPEIRADMERALV